MPAPSATNFHRQCQEPTGEFGAVEHEVGQDIRGLARHKMSLYGILRGEALLSRSTVRNMKPDHHDSERARAAAMTIESGH